MASPLPLHLLRLRAARKVARLLKSPRAERERCIRRRRSSWSDPLVVEELLAASIRRGAGDPEEARHCVNLAQQIGEMLVQADARAVGGMAHLYDLYALIQAHHGNAHRLARDFPAAAKRFNTARGFLEVGSGEPLPRARVLSLVASLLMDTLRFTAALHCLEEAEKLLAGSSAHKTLGTVLLQRANVLGFLSHKDEAIAVQHRACEVLRYQEDPRLTAAAVVNLGADYCILGRHLEARQLLRSMEDILDGCADLAIRLRRQWLQGMIFEGLGDPRAAETSFVNVRAAFLARGNAYDAFQVSLDLAALKVRHGSAEQVRAVAAELGSLLEHEQVRGVLHPEGRAAVQDFLNAAVERRADPTLAAAVVAAVRQPRPAAERPASS